MALTMLVGQRARLTFLAAQAGIDPATLTAVHWSQQGAPDAIRLTQPDLVEALAPGVAEFTCAATAAPPERMTYRFAIECVAVEPPLPVSLPVTLAPL